MSPEMATKRFQNLKPLRVGIDYNGNPWLRFGISQGVEILVARREACFGKVLTGRRLELERPAIWERDAVNHGVER
jgi:hypothetical protein